MSFCGFKTEGFSRWSSVDWWVKVSMNALLFNSALIILYFTGLLAFEHVLFLRSTRQTARHISGFYIKLPFARLLRSSLRISTWRLHSSLLRLLFQLPRHSDFKTSAFRVSTSIASLLLLWSFLTNPFVPCEILLYRTYSGSFWRVSESWYSLISIQYRQLQTHSVLYASILYFPLLLIWCTGFFVMFCFRLFGVWSFTAV